MVDMTLMYITANRLPEHWQKFQIETLLRAADGLPIVSVSKQPMALGHNIVESNPWRYWAIYQAMYLAAQAARTPYVAQVEDDVLYSQQHFHEYRPPRDTFSYNRARWSLFCWEKDPIFCMRQRISNCTLIAPRDQLLRALEERFAKHPEGASDELTGEIGREKVDRRLGVSIQKMREWYSSTPVVQLNHPCGIDETQQIQHKAHGQMKAHDVPFWGRASAIADRFYNRDSTSLLQFEERERSVKTQPKRGSHLPVLTYLAENTQGAVAELGCGMYSTPYLHWYCFRTNRRLVTFEDNPQWFDFIKQFASGKHEVRLVTDWDAEQIDGSEFDLVLIDHDNPGKRKRYVEAARFRDARYVVCHDTENRNDHKYLFTKLHPLFNYRAKYTKAGLPYTSVFSNYHPVSMLPLFQ